MSHFGLLLFLARFVTPGPEATDKLDINQVAFTITAAVPVARQDIIILTREKDLNEAEVQSSFKVSHLGRPTINKLITLGGQVPLHFTLSPL